MKESMPLDILISLVILKVVRWLSRLIRVWSDKRKNVPNSILMSKTPKVPSGHEIQFNL